MEWQRSRSAVRDRDGVVGSQEYGGRAFVPKRSITAEQTRRLIEEHFATIARRSTPQNLIKESCGTGPGASPTNGVVLFRYGPARGNRRLLKISSAGSKVSRGSSRGRSFGRVDDVNGRQWHLSNPPLTVAG